MCNNKFKLLRIVMLGAPASGKGTIAKRIVERYNFKHIAPGDILRLNVLRKTELGLSVKKYLDDGQLVPDDLVNKCVLDHLADVNDSPWLLDGFPRNVNQAKILKSETNIDAVINLNVPIDVIVERVKGRWIHLASGRIYNIGFNQPKNLYKDDVTGEDLVQRDDDKPEIVRKRLKIYTEITAPVLQYYRQLGLLTEFAGRTTNEIWPKLEEFLFKK